MLIKSSLLPTWAVNIDTYMQIFNFLIHTPIEKKNHLSKKLVFVFGIRSIANCLKLFKHVILIDALLLMLFGSIAVAIKQLKGK